MKEAWKICSKQNTNVEDVVCTKGLYYRKYIVKYIYNIENRNYFILADAKTGRDMEGCWVMYNYQVRVENSMLDKSELKE